MKKVFVIFFTIILTIIFLLYLKSFYKEKGNIRTDNNITANIIYKGLQGARSFTFDESGNIYVAFKNKIQYIDTAGKSYNIVNDASLNIDSIEYYNNVLYYSSRNKLILYDISKKEGKTLLNTLPNFGDYKHSLLKIFNDQLYITIGAATNSGVVGLDNEWLRNNPFNHDFSPKDITLKGINFGEEKTGAFTSYGTKNFSGQIVSSHSPGNASILIYNLKTNNYETYAYGIRNVKGLDFNSESKLIATVGGMEDRGLRPVKGDSDYIYEIKKNLWYGWPDYSGGDPVNSPKFKGNINRSVGFILENHPTTNPPAPLYQYSTLNSLGTLAIDKNGSIGEKDSIYFYDFKDNIIYKLTKGAILKQEIFLEKHSNIVSMKFYDDKLILLDSNSGYVYRINKGTSDKHISLSNISKGTLWYAMGLVVIGMIVALMKLKRS